MGYGRLSVCLKTSFRVFICLNGFGRLNKHNSSSHWFFYDKFFISLLLWLPEFSLTVKFYVFFFSLKNCFIVTLKYWAWKFSFEHVGFIEHCFKAKIPWLIFHSLQLFTYFYYFGIPSYWNISHFYKILLLAS